MEYTNNVTLESPKNLSDLFSNIIKNPESTLFAGGTYIMSRPGYFPQKNLHSYISLSEVPELRRVLHSDKYLELGSMVTITQLLNASTSSLAKPIYKAINSISANILRNRITIGGALCIEHCRTNLCCILCAINAVAEVRFITSSGLLRKKNTTRSRWIPVSKLYDSDGRYLYPGNSVLTRIRIPSDPSVMFIYNSVGTLNYSKDGAVTLAMQYTMSQNIITSVSFCLSFFDNGIFIAPDFESFIRSIKFPLSQNALQKTANELIKLLHTECTKTTELQKERAVRLTLAALQKINEEYFKN